MLHQNQLEMNKYKKRLASANLFLWKWIASFILVEGLLVFSRLQLNHFNLYKQKVQLYDILEERTW
ncbi:hypothetical protein EXW51_10180 [Bacillus mycoides]|nr:hypothetical protein EXW51_10180 [Bacillus mycoides]